MKEREEKKEEHLKSLLTDELPLNDIPPFPPQLAATAAAITPLSAAAVAVVAAAVTASPGGQ